MVRTLPSMTVWYDLSFNTCGRKTSDAGMPYGRGGEMMEGPMPVIEGYLWSAIATKTKKRYATSPSKQDTWPLPAKSEHVTKHHVTQHAYNSTCPSSVRLGLDCTPAGRNNCRAERLVERASQAQASECTLSRSHSAIDEIRHR